MTGHGGGMNDIIRRQILILKARIGLDWYGKPPPDEGLYHDSRLSSISDMIFSRSQERKSPKLNSA